MTIIRYQYCSNDHRSYHSMLIVIISQQIAAVSTRSLYPVAAQRWTRSDGNLRPPVNCTYSTRISVILHCPTIN